MMVTKSLLCRPTARRIVITFARLVLTAFLLAAAIGYGYWCGQNVAQKGSAIGWLAHPIRSFALIFGVLLDIVLLATVCVACCAAVRNGAGFIRPFIGDISCRMGRHRTPRGWLRMFMRALTFGALFGVAVPLATWAIDGVFASPPHPASRSLASNEYWTGKAALRLSNGRRISGPVHVYMTSDGHLVVDLPWPEIRLRSAPRAHPAPAAPGLHL